MSNTNPARGMRDFLPDQIRKRNYVIGVIKEVYEKYGFEPLETPTIENLSTLTNKYGEEGDQLMYKILKRGEKLKKQLKREDDVKENDLADLALRYDLTVPLARVVANYKNDLPKFFKRYQIQPVWRADRPARGRYREFYQCDVDAIGSKSMVVEAELCSAVSEILEQLGFRSFSILLNHRVILKGILEVCGIDEEKHSDALVSLDKLSKIGTKRVLGELREKAFTEVSLVKFEQFIATLSAVGDGYDVSDDQRTNEKRRRESLNKALIANLSNFVGENESAKLGIEKLNEILAHSTNTHAEGRISVFPNLARGLSYYTGAIFEIGLDNEEVPLSIAGGGRYDELIGMFGKEEIPAVGLSLGLERILLIMEERRMFPDDLQTNAADVLVTLWNEETAGESLKLASDLRQNGLRVTVYPQADKLGKQFKYADQINAPFVCVLGETEIAENKVTLKNMKSGDQETISVEEAIKKLV